MNKKIYIVLQTTQNYEGFHAHILGVHTEKENAKKEIKKEIADNVQNFDFVVDEYGTENIKDDIIIFWKYQENWDNYIEYHIIEKNIEM